MTTESDNTPERNLEELRELKRHFGEVFNWPETVEGVPAGVVEGAPVYLPLEGHSITIGASGEGKFTSVIALMALHDIRDDRGLGCGMVFIDPKDGEAARKTGPYRTDLREEMTFVLDPYNEAGGSDCLNPFDFIDPTADDFFEQCSGLAKALIVQRPKDKRGNDFIWDSRGAEWLRAVIAYLVREPDEERTIMRVREIFSSSADAFAAVMERMSRQEGAPAFIRNSGHDMLRVTTKAEREASGYIATIMEATQFADSALMQRVLRHSTFDPIVVRSLGGTVYVVTSDVRLETSAPWVRLVCEVIRQRVLKSTVKRQVHWVIDEAKAFDAWNFIEDGIRALRASNISLHLFYQNVGQLKAVWGEGWTSITDCKLIRFLGSSDVETCKWIIELAGETTIIEVSQSEGENHSSGSSRAFGRTNGSSHASSSSESENWNEGESESDAETLGYAIAFGVNTSSQRNKHVSLGLNSSRNVGRALSKSTTLGWSRALSFTEGESDSSSMTTGGGKSGMDVTISTQRGTSYSKTRSYGVSGATTMGDTLNEGLSNGFSLTRSDGSGSSRGRSLTETGNSSRAHTAARNRGRGANRGNSTTDTLNHGTSTTDTYTFNNGTSNGVTYTEKRRLLTVDEVRRLDKDAVVLFVNREPDCVITRAHYFDAPSLVERMLIGFVAKNEREQGSH